MTPRQRILAALNHQQPDRVPIDFGGHRSSGISAIAYRKLRGALGLPERTIRVYDPIQQLAVIDADVLDRFGADAIELGRGFALDDQDWADWALPDGRPARCRPGPCPSGSRAVGAAFGQRPDPSQDAGRGVVLRAIYWPYLETDDLDRLPEALAENMWCAIASPPGPLAAGRRAPGA